MAADGARTPLRPVPVRDTTFYPFDRSGDIMRIATITGGESSNLIVWHRVTRVHYISEGRQRWIVLTYDNGATRNIAPHQGRDLWYKVEHHKGCPMPCYYRHESTTAPTECKECQLAEMLEGLDIEVRPDRVPPRWIGWPVRTIIIVAQSIVILLLLWALLAILTSPATQATSTPPPAQDQKPNQATNPPAAPYTSEKARPAENRGGERTDVH